MLIIRVSIQKAHKVINLDTRSRWIISIRQRQFCVVSDVISLKLNDDTLIMWTGVPSYTREVARNTASKQEV